MNWIVKHAKWIALVMGVLNCTVAYGLTELALGVNPLAFFGIQVGHWPADSLLVIDVAAVLQLIFVVMFGIYLAAVRRSH